ncbi:superoxide dismutase [Aspergillus ambiguus]|uniref:putative cytosolic Cu/Zn superoxide dismutase n=1 Tax=Aspergillus ambiguus TaxID=176160 RepID=UPI003CCD3E89
MFAKSLVIGLFALALGAKAVPEAPVVTDNSPTDVYTSQLLIKDNTTVRGHVTSYSPDGVGVTFRIALTGIEGHQALKYHIHEKPVPEDGNCYATGAHLDPTRRGEDPPCDILNPATCQVGDLSGKHGPAFAPEDSEFLIEYTDYFVSNVPGNPAYYGNLSWVVHLPDEAKTRLNCGNFEKMGLGA